jgi:hypothetical protein
MRIRVSKILLLVATLLIGCPPVSDAAAGAAALADPVPIRLAKLNPANWQQCPGQSDINVRCPTLAVDFGQTIPPSLQVEITTKSDSIWKAQSLDLASATLSQVPVLGASVRQNLTGLVFLVFDMTFAPILDPAKNLITVTYARLPTPTVISQGPVEQDEDVGVLVDAEDPDDPDLLFSGKVTATHESSPKFSFEARLRKTWFQRRNEWGILGEVVAEEQGDVDPDSITIGSTYARVIQPLRGKIDALPFAGEFARDDPKTKGWITGADFRWNALPTQAGLIAVNLLAGAAVGNNLTNAISTEGSGGVVRGKFGAEAWTRWERLLGFKKATFIAEWTVLALGKPEIDPERLDASGMATLTKRARHRFKADLELGFTSRFAFVIQYRQGPLPPAFEQVKPTVSINLSYKADFR